MTKRNWARDRERVTMQGHGAESINGGTIGPLPRSLSPSKDELRKQATAAVIATPNVPSKRKLPVVVDKFWRNRLGESIVVQLREYEGRVLIDVRVHYTDANGKTQPTVKGVSCVVLRLPDLAKAINKAVQKARELGLLGKGEQ
jgi:hypothetical protein